MKKITALFATLLFFSLVFLPRNVFALNTVEVVNSNTSAGENLPGWMFNRDLSTQTPYEFNNDFFSIGAGGLYVKPIGANASDKFIAENFINTPISSISAITYDFRIGSTISNTQKDQFYMNVYANFGISDDLKFYDCRYNIVPSVGSNSSFTSVTFNPNDSYVVTTRGGASASPFSCPAKPVDMDLLSPNSNIRVFALNVGDTSLSDQGLDGYLDKVVIIKTNGDTITYDFEKDLPDVTAPSLPVHTSPANNAVLNVHNFTFDWTDATDSSTPISYMWQASYSPSLNPDGSFATVLASHTNLSISEVSSPSTPDGVYYWQVLATDAKGNKTQWTTPWKVSVVSLTTPPTKKDQCKNNGWQSFNNPPFKNQGQCVAYVEKHDRDEDDKKCESNGWRRFINRIFKNEKDCKENNHKDNHKDEGDKGGDKEKNTSIEAEGKYLMSGPKQQFKFDITDYGANSNKDKGEIEYWNYEYQGNKTLHYKAKSICSTVNKQAKSMRVLFQIPAGHPGLTGLYIVATVVEDNFYGHSATTSLVNATQWCETGVGFSPVTFPVTSGQIKIKN